MAKIKAKRGPEVNLNSITLDDGEFAVTTNGATRNLYVGLGGQNILIASSASLGDMSKGIYDTDNDGIVDQAEKVEWSGVLNKVAASSAMLGCVKIGANISVTPDGTISGNSNPESFIPKQESFTITNGQTTFNLTKGYYTPGSLTWSIYGFQQPKESITEVSSTSFAIPPGLEDGTELEVQYIQTVNLIPFPYHKDEHLPGGVDDLGLKDVALSGSYEDLSDKPTIDELQKKMLTGNTVSANYFTFAESLINTLNYSATFRITVTSGTVTTIRHELIVRIVGNGTATPEIVVESSILSASAANSGIRYIRVAYPKTLNNGYKVLIDLYTYDTSSRDIVVELLESNNINLSSSISASAYNSTYQSSLLSASLYYAGTIVSGTIYGTASGASSATWSYYFYNDSYVAGEALVANDILFLQTDNKWYKANVAGRTIPFGTIIGRCYTTYALGATVGCYTTGRWTLPTGITSTIGKELYIRGTITGGIFTNDGTITDSLIAGYSYIRLGSIVYNTSTIMYDGNNRVYTVSAKGITAIDGINFDANTLDGKDSSDFANATHDHVKADIIDMPTKLSDFENDIGAGGGIKITTSISEPTETVSGEFWYKVL